MTDWIVGPPTPEQVAEHAKRHPYGFVAKTGHWLRLRRGYDGAELCLLSVGIQEGIVLCNSCCGWQTLEGMEDLYLPVTAEGLPVDYAALKAENAAIRAAAIAVLSYSWGPSACEDYCWSRIAAMDRLKAAVAQPWLALGGGSHDKE